MSMISYNGPLHTDIKSCTHTLINFQSKNSDKVYVQAVWYNETANVLIDDTSTTANQEDNEHVNNGIHNSVGR